MPLSETLDHALNSPLIGAPEYSYIAVSADRVLLFFLALHATHRLLQLLWTLPRRGKRPLLSYLRNPWWRVPAAMIGAGITGLGLNMIAQVLIGDQGQHGQLTPYLLIGHVCMALVFGGVAYGAGKVKSLFGRVQ